MKKKIHFGWFAGTAYGPRGWDAPYAPQGYDWRQPEVYQEMAAICERGKFDYALFADYLGIPIAYRGSIDTAVKYGLEGVYHDTSVLSAMVAAKTKNIGVGTTVTTSLTPPYILARQTATLDHLTKGRTAWNVVTSGNIAGYLNMGYDQMLEHDEAYDRADEYMDLCMRLWSSWEPDAVVMDKKTGVFADPSKVHAINYEGKYYKSKGPLNVAPMPQGRPAIIQAGASERGREFAARWADAVITPSKTVDEMKAYYDDIKGRMIKHGRNPDELKVFFIVKPVVGETKEIANLKKIAQTRSTDAVIHSGLAFLSSKIRVDLSQFDLDEPPPELDQREIDARSMQGGPATLVKYNSLSRTKTLREIAIEEETGEKLPILGDPEQVADQLEELMEAVGGDGFAIRVDAHNHLYMEEFVNTVVPILQKRDLARTEYTGKTLREHLAEF